MSEPVPAGRAFVRLPPSAVLAIVAVILFVLVALAPAAFASAEGLRSGAWGLQAPNVSHPLGTDILGRDVWARLVFSARTSLSVGALATIVALTAGVLSGALAALLGGWWDELIMRAAEIADSVPALLLALLLVTVLGPGLVPVSLVIGLTGWLAVARLMRAELLLARNAQYVIAARGLGASHFRFFVRHLAPEALIPLVALIPFRVEGAVIVEAGLSFLGVEDGSRPSWGVMLRDAQPVMLDAWWLVAAPAATLALLLFSLALLADHAHRALAPQSMQLIEPGHYGSVRRSR